MLDSLILCGLASAFTVKCLIITLLKIEKEKKDLGCVFPQASLTSVLTASPQSVIQTSSTAHMEKRKKWCVSSKATRTSDVDVSLGLSVLARRL